MQRRNAGKVRILHVLYSFKHAGSEVLSREIVRSIRDAEHFVIALEYPGDLESDLQTLGARTLCIKRMDRGRLRPLADLTKAIWRFRPSVVHIHHIHQLFYALPGSLLAGATVVHTEHSLHWLELPKMRKWFRLLLRFCDAATGVNESVASCLVRYIGMPARKVHMIPNGVDSDRFASANSIRGALGLSSEHWVVGIVARLVELKGHEFLIEAFKSVSADRPEARLLIVGDGPRREQLQQMARSLEIGDKVNFLGNRQDVSELLASMDVVVLCSLWEGLPFSVLEAMAAARPIVATAVGGIPSLIQSGTTGILTHPGRSDDLAIALADLHARPDFARTLGAAAANLVRRNYSLDRAAKQYRFVYGLDAVPPTKGLPPNARSD